MDYDHFLTRNGQLEFWTEQKNSFKNVKIIGNQIILKLDFAQFFCPFILLFKQCEKEARKVLRLNLIDIGLDIQ